MFRLGGISNIREMWFAQKMNGKKKKPKSFSLLVRNSGGKLSGSLNHLYLIMNYFLNRCLIDFRLMHGHGNPQLHMLVRYP